VTLSALMLNGVGVTFSEFVTVDETALRQRGMELLEELSKQTRFGHAIAHGEVLSLGARLGDDVLLLGRTGD
jgi:hypothetical protein